MSPMSSVCLLIVLALGLVVILICWRPLLQHFLLVFSSRPCIGCLLHTQRHMITFMNAGESLLHSTILLWYLSSFLGIMIIYISFRLLASVMSIFCLSPWQPYLSSVTRFFLPSHLISFSRLNIWSWSLYLGFSNFMIILIWI